MAAAKEKYVVLKAKVLWMNVQCSGGLSGLRVAIKFRRWTASGATTDLG
jgi:hypothetical protein